jgi:hypothetical protein
MVNYEARITNTSSMIFIFLTFHFVTFRQVDQLFQARHKTSAKQIQVLRHRLMALELNGQHFQKLFEAINSSFDVGASAAIREIDFSDETILKSQRLTGWLVSHVQRRTKNLQLFTTFIFGHVFLMKFRPIKKRKIPFNRTRTVLQNDTKIITIRS